MAKDKNYKTVENDTPLKSFIPTDYSDVGQGALLARAYNHCLCYCEGIGWLVYENGIWTPSDIAAQGYSQKLTDLQLQEANLLIQSAFNSSKQSILNEKDYLTYAKSRRSSAKIASTLKEATPLLSINTATLDSDPLLLNTPDGEVHLGTGEMTSHEPSHYITHMTKTAPSDEGSELWNNFILQVTCGNEEVADFLQQLAGMFAIGKVYEERLIIAVGSGGNGKSTFFNAIQDVLGDYSGTIRSELMIASNDSGKKFEYARLRGKRFIIAEELEEGKQLDTAAVKHLCSTGDINAQFKGKDIFTFKPSHSTVLCTNHMPAVKAFDDGTWDRLVVIPFRGRFRNQETEIKNYGAYLVENCGGAILKWIIEGAQIYINNDYKLIIPEEIKTAVTQYQKDNDCLSDFFEARLCFGSGESASGSELYSEYENYCQCEGIHAQPQTVVLPRIAEQPGVKKTRTSKATRYLGVGVNKPESLKIFQNNARQCRGLSSIERLCDDIFGA